MEQFSAGLIVYTDSNGERLYLLLQYVSGHWDFPKGKIEKRETKEQAALRELYEETGLTAEVVPNFEQVLSYWFRDYTTKNTVHKTVYFLIGYTQEQVVTLSHEHTDYAWLAYQQALAQLTYDNAKRVLEAVETFLQE